MSACFAIDVQLIYVQETEEIFNRGKNEVIEDGIQHIKDRLTNTSTDSVAKTMSVFETFTCMWPRQKLESLGDGITVLFNHYRPLICETQKENVEDLTEKVLSQWYEYGIRTSAVTHQPKLLFHFTQIYYLFSPQAMKEVLT